MNKYARKLLLASLAVIFMTTAYANGAFFDSASNTLHIPAVKVGDRYVANARLKLETNGLFVIQDFIELSDSEHAMLEIIENLPCGPADILGRLAARNAFVSGDEVYCLVKDPIITDEGGRIFNYLLIKNGTVRFSIDTRDDGFGQCCFEKQRFGKFTQVRFGFVQNDTFTEQTAVDQIDFEREYILQLIGDRILEF